jgi:hypothetical protein
VSNRNCTSRAEWRLQTGKPAEALSAHYRLDCDYGTAVIVCWEKGGNEPIYVCESHAKQLGSSREHGPEARIVTAPAEPADNPIKLEREDQPRTQEDQPRTQEASGTKSNGSAPLPEAPRSPAETRVGRATTGASARSRLRDLTFGNSAKAMVDEAIWNLAIGDYEVYRTALQQGKPAREAAQAAGGQLAVIHQKISEYTLKLEAVLSESKATVHLEENVDKPLEQAMLEAIGNESMSDQEKDSVIQQLGAVQEWVKRGLKGDITPLQANEIILAIGERLNWGGSTEVPEECKAVYRTLYTRLKNAVRTEVPEAQNLQDRLTNLYAAKCDLERELLATKELT